MINFNSSRWKLTAAMHNKLTPITNKFAVTDIKKTKVRKIRALKAWENLIDRANQIYNDKEYQKALKFYQNSLEHLFIHKDICLVFDPESYLSAVTVNHFNLADNYISLQQYENAITSFDKALLFATGIYNNYQTQPLVLIATDKAVRHIIVERAHLLKTHSSLRSSSSNKQFEILLNKWAGMDSSPLYH